jgi:large subunit ribosomal protein L10
MALNLEQKKQVVAEVAAVAAKAYSAVAAEYRGITVEDLNNLRVEARNNGVYLRVVKNTLARRAVENTDFECMQDSLTGPLILAFSQEDPGAAARVFGAFAKKQDKFVVRVISIGKRVLPASELDRLAKMPTKDQAIAMLMGVMKAPIEKLARTLQEPHAKLVRTIAAVRDAKQGGAS